jgi:hypothetical protein
MPTNRPEFLALALERLAAARCRPEIHIYVDDVSESTLREVEVVRDRFLSEAFLFSARPHVKAPSGCWNILNSIKAAAEWAEDVYLVEDDIMVTPDFFEWHQAQTTEVSCGRKDPRFFPAHPYMYTNPGSCLRRPALDRILPHINDDYFARLRGYLDEHFAPAPEWSELDDGLIRRLVGMCAYPDKAVCYHQGIRSWGKSNLFPASGDVMERVEQLRETIRRIEAGDPLLRRYAYLFDSSARRGE